LWSFWYISPRLGFLYQEKSGSPAFVAGPETNAMNSESFFGGKMAFSIKKADIYVCPKIGRHIWLQEKRQFCRRKLAKIAENCHNNIDNNRCE
jgi:hypothetical protein